MRKLSQAEPRASATFRLRSTRQETLRSVFPCCLIGVSPSVWAGFSSCGPAVRLPRCSKTTSKLHRLRWSPSATPASWTSGRGSEKYSAIFSRTTERASPTTGRATKPCTGSPGLIVEDHLAMVLSDRCMRATLARLSRARSFRHAMGRSADLTLPTPHRTAGLGARVARSLPRSVSGPRTPTRIQPTLRRHHRVASDRPPRIVPWGRG